MSPAGAELRGFSREYLLSIFDFDPAAGTLHWRERPANHFPSRRECTRWNNRHAGTRAGSIDKVLRRYPYRRVGIRDKDRKLVHLAEHRIIYFLAYGEVPPSIDHINQDSLDNRPTNLRAASHQENHKNRKKAANNTSGVTGVTWHRQRRRWMAQFYLDGKRKYIGLFDNIEDAAEAVRTARLAAGYSAAHGG